MRKKFGIKKEPMKRIFILCLIGFFVPAWGQNSGVPSASKVPEVESAWPGILMQIPEVKRIPGNRLLFAVRLMATAKAPASTLIGMPGVHPPGATEEELLALLPPTPFSLGGSTMIEERTQQKYEMMAPDPKGPSYRPGGVSGSLSPGQVLYMTIQFPAPPPPPPDKNGVVPKQTVSILLPKAQGPILHVVVPPETPSTSAASQ
jgi:hypothetical protein